MLINGKAWKTIWREPGAGIGVIDQRRLPHQFTTVRLHCCEDAAAAIRHMVVRGAPLIGVTGAYGLALAMGHDASDQHLECSKRELLHSRPTAVNLRWALCRMEQVLQPCGVGDRYEAAMHEADRIAAEDEATCSAIGDHGLPLIQAIAARKALAREPVRVLTHCNAGWLGTVDWGTALAPLYKAHRRGIALEVWVDETRPRNQGASLTTFELAGEGIDHRVIVDNAGGHLMQHGLVDLVIVGSDRTTATGDVCNKIGTYLKALAARDNGVPFHVALPSSTIDWTLSDGIGGIPIEERSAQEVTQIQGLAADGEPTTVQLTPPDTAASNPGFDVTPARLVTGFITERGLCAASPQGLASLFPHQEAEPLSPC